MIPGWKTLFKQSRSTIYSTNLCRFINHSFGHLHIDQPNTCRFQPPCPIYARRFAFQYTTASSPAYNFSYIRLKNIYIFLFCTYADAQRTVLNTAKTVNLLNRTYLASIISCMGFTTVQLQLNEHGLYKTEHKERRNEGC